MRLINVHTGELREFVETIPPYAVTSHRWLNRDGQRLEVKYKEYVARTGQTKPGYSKIVYFRQAAKKLVPGIDWIWIDTCCIKNGDSAEVGEAITSMFRWYTEAAICLAYLHDVPAGPNVWPRFFESEWFKRGWTLQELLAPQCVVFLAQDWTVLGHKQGLQHLSSVSTQSCGSPINDIIVQATGIPGDVLRDARRVKNLGWEVTQTWMKNRKTTKPEDMAYCQIGLHDIGMTPRYGERGKAYQRLRKKIQNRDQASQPPAVQVQHYRSPSPPTRTNFIDFSSDSYYSDDSSEDGEFKVRHLLARLKRRNRRSRRVRSPDHSTIASPEEFERDQQFMQEHREHLEHVLQSKQTMLENEEQIRQQRELHEKAYRETQERIRQDQQNVWQAQMQIQQQIGHFQQAAMHQGPVQQFPTQQTPLQQVPTQQAPSQQRHSQQYQSQQYPAQQGVSQVQQSYVQQYPIQQRPMWQAQQQGPVQQFQNAVVRYN